MLDLMILRIFLLGLFLVSTACTSMVIGGGQSVGTYEQEDDRSLEQVEADANITREIQQLLQPYKSVNVDTANGIVTLSGSVSSEYDIHQITNQIYRINGVRRVESFLRVKAP